MSLKVNKKTALIIIICILVIASLVKLIFYLRSGNLKLNSQFSSLQANFEKTTKDYTEVTKEYREVKNKYEKLTTDFEVLTKERDNLLIQIKGLLVDRNLARQLEGAADKNKQELDALTKEKQVLTEETLEQKGIIRKLQLQQEKLFEEKKQLSDELARERNVSLLRRVEQEKANLQKENGDLTNNLKLSKVKIHQLQEMADKLQRDLDKSKTEGSDVSLKLDRLNQKFAEALEKNKKLEQKIVEEPKKFAEIARQNKLLIKQTANMHYNLGVFYTKQKEYTRALAEFEKAIELNPNDAYSHFNLGYIYAEHLVDRERAIKQFREFLRLAKKDDKDVDWVKRYLLTWESWEGKKPLD
jgi:tetratricopeptide (TPR) repeat protein